MVGLARWGRFVLPALFLAVAGCSQVNPAHEKGTLVALGGDTHFGESYVRSAPVSDAEHLSDEDRYTRGFVHLKPFIDRAAFTVVNFEAPVSGTTEDAILCKDYIHYADPEATAAALKAVGIDAVSLANNHSMDQGAKGLANSLEALSAAGIAAFGAGDDLDKAEAPLLKEIQRPGGGKMMIAIFGLFEEREVYRRKYDFYAEARKPGAAPLDPRVFRQQVAALRKQHQDLFVIAYPHWGSNYSWARGRQVDFGHALVDAGADMVVGHHGHTAQDIERYKDKWILYGIGNFLFNSPGRYAENPDILPYSLVAELSFGRAAGSEPTVRLYPISSDNRRTGYQPNLVKRSEAETILQALKTQRRSIGFDGEVVGNDATGAAIELTPLSWTNWW